MAEGSWERGVKGCSSGLRVTERLGKENDDGNYGSAATRDLEALQAISRRIHYVQEGRVLEWREDGRGELGAGREGVFVRAAGGWCTLTPFPRPQPRFVAMTGKFLPRCSFSSGRDLSCVRRGGYSSGGRMAEGSWERGVKGCSSGLRAGGARCVSRLLLWKSIILVDGPLTPFPRPQPRFVAMTGKFLPRCSFSIQLLSSPRSANPFGS
jgi:hypothetical protein